MTKASFFIFTPKCWKNWSLYILSYSSDASGYRQRLPSVKQQFYFCVQKWSLGGVPSDMGVFNNLKRVFLSSKPDALSVLKEVCQYSYTSKPSLCRQLIPTKKCFSSYSLYQFPKWTKLYCPKHFYASITVPKLGLFAYKYVGGDEEGERRPQESRP